jgi:hypothetical protein
LFSRNDELRLPITNDEDLNKVIAIAEANGSNKLNFFLTRKRPSTVSQKMLVTNNDDLGSISDDGHIFYLNDISLDSPPPGTIAPQQRRTIINSTNKSTTSNDGGVFIPESVSFYFCIHN